jgi:hypothetical protein
LQQVAQQKYQSKLIEMAQKGRIAADVMEQLATPAMLQNYIKTNRDEIEATAKVMSEVPSISHSPSAAPSSSSICLLAAESHIR